MIMRNVPGRTFNLALALARECSPRVAEFTSAPDEVPTSDRVADYFLSDDNRSGFMIQKDNGELRALFSLEKGRGNDLVRIATYHGARCLDCFDGYLFALYSSFGFTVYKREPNWTPGGPDVLYMER